MAMFLGAEEQRTYIGLSVVGMRFLLWRIRNGLLKMLDDFRLMMLLLMLLVLLMMLWDLLPLVLVLGFSRGWVLLLLLLRLLLLLDLFLLGWA